MMRSFSKTLAVAAALSTSALAAEISIEPFASPADAPITVRWVKDGETSWYADEPTFVLGKPTDDPYARGWIATSDMGVLLHVVVKDSRHVNTRSGGDIWDGDALQIGFDATAAGVGALNKGSEHVGRTVSALACALVANGPETFAYFHGTNGGGPKPDQKPAIVRDEKAGTTTYDILLPWADYGVRPGTTAEFAIAVQVNDTDDGPRQQRMYFGRGADGTPRPGLFQRIAIGAPPGQVYSIAFTRTAVWEAGGNAEAIVALAGAPDIQIHANLGEIEKSIRPPAQSQGAGITRYRVLARVGELPTGALPFTVSLQPDNGKALTRQAAVTAPGRTVQELDRELQQLAATATSDLVARHFKSLRAVFADDWNKALQRVETNPEMASECAAHAKTALEHLRKEPQTHTAEYFLQRGRRGMIRTLISSEDRGLGFYQVSLPPKYDPAKAYPLIVFLHGHGDPHPLAFAAGAVAPLGQTAADGATDREPAIRLMPWARGNYGYHDIANSEVLDAIADVRRTFKVDADRTYLMGHSMGGGGTWGLALQYPDMFAAAAVCAGGAWFIPAGQGYGINAQHLPMMLWHGDADGAVSVDEAYVMQRELQSAGNSPTMRIVSGRGHGMEPADTEGVEQWLLQHRRQRPSEFAYKVYNYDGRGAWGVSMHYDGSRSEHPQLTCRVDGNTVHITAPDASSVTVNAGEGGLGLKGEVTINVNAVERYRGPAAEVDVDLARRQ